MSYKSKIYLVVALFLGLTLVMFLVIFSKLQSRNEVLSQEVSKQLLTLEQLQQEQRSYEQGQKDLASLKTKQIQPNDLLSKDTKVVKEITTLEDLSKAHALTMNLQVSGTAKDAQKVKTSNQLLSVPYTIILSGQFPNVLAFIDNMEHLSFITPVKTLNVNAMQEGGVKATITADFYLQK